MKANSTRTSSLATRIGLLYAGSMLVLFVILGLLVRQTARDSIAPMATELAVELVSARADSINQVIAGHLLNIRSMSRREVIGNANPEVIAADLISREAEVPPMYEIMFFAVPDGTYVATSGAVGNVGDRDYFVEIMRNGAAYTISNPVISRSTGHPIIVIAHEVRNTDGLRVGLVVAHPDPELRMSLSIDNADSQGFSGLSALAAQMRDNETGKARISSTTGLVRDIAEKSDGLLDANSANQSIASQTNLLAVNAAIEAALEEINQVTQDVHSGSGEMAEGSRIILEEMQRLVGIIHEVESSMNEMAAGGGKKD